MSVGGYMKIFDLHCDALLRLWEHKDRSFTDDPNLNVNYEKLQKGKVKLQTFAIFLEPELPSDQKFQYAMEQADIFHNKVIAKHEKIKKISNWSDIRELKDDEIGAVLALEGADPIGNDIMKLRTFYQLGVKSIGLTWNNANLCGDGTGEARGGGLTELGFDVVRLNNQYGVLTDVSHLSQAGFWNVIDTADYPIATHSNSMTVCNHVRNLTDEQAQAIFSKGGFIGLVFAPQFVKEGGNATIDDVLKHVEHFCELGGKEHIALGSDFDGISKFVKDLEDAGQYQNLINELLKHYSEDVVRGFAYENILNRLP